MVAAPDLGSGVERCVGSSPIPRTKKIISIDGFRVQLWKEL